MKMKPTKKQVTRMGLSLLLGLGLLSQTGCAVLLIGGGVAAGIGGYAYVRGELKVTENASLDLVWDAALAAMKELEFPVTSQKKDSLTAELIARTARDKKVHLALKGLSDNSTELKIRVGAFGDEALSLTIQERIKKKL